MANEFPNFAGDRAPAIIDRQQHIKELQEKENQIKRSKREEINRINDYYQNYLDKIAKEEELLRAELYNLIDVDNGETSVTTSLGNVQARLTKDKWVWGTQKAQRELAGKLPIDLIKVKKVYEINKDKLKRETTVTPEGKVVLTDTGELLDGITVQKGGKPTVTVKFNKEAQ